MKRFLFTLALAGVVFSAAAQEPERKEEKKEEGYRFTDVKVLPTNAIKNQYRSGTCWCFSTLSFLEDEIRRAGGGEIDLAEMWIVRNIYFEKAVKYVRLHGSLNFAVGGAAHLGAGLALGDGIVCRLHLLEVLFGGGVVGVQVRVPALALGAVCFFDLVIACAARNAQHLIGVSHGYTSSRLISRSHSAAQCL